jgi:late competence protein required for DNA uptake (superfamily II DNA/RNA helicase)
MPDEMKRIVRCKYCGCYEYYGEMRWLSGKCCCRDCYKDNYAMENGKLYEWDDLEGPRPTKEDFMKQEAEENGNGNRTQVPNVRMADSSDTCK